MGNVHIILLGFKCVHIFIAVAVFFFFFFFPFVSHKGELTLKGLEEFERKYFAGELEEHFKSEVVSAGDDAGPLKVVKRQSFKSMVVDNGASNPLRF